MNDEITITITVGPNGCRVEGPLHDKITCYGILKLAEQSIAAFDGKANGHAPLIVPATPGLRIT